MSSIIRPRGVHHRQTTPAQREPPADKRKVSLDLRLPEVELGYAMPIQSGEFGESNTVRVGTYLPAVTMDGWQAGLHADLSDEAGVRQFGQLFSKGKTARAGLEIRTPREKNSGIRLFAGGGLSYYQTTWIDQSPMDEVQERGELAARRQAGMSLAEATKLEKWAYGSVLDVDSVAFYIAAGIDVPLTKNLSLRTGVEYSKRNAKISGGVDRDGKPGPRYDVDMGGLQVGASLLYHFGDDNTGPTLFDGSSDFYFAPYSGVTSTTRGDAFPIVGGELGVHKGNRDYYVDVRYGKNRAFSLYDTTVGSSDELYGGIGFGYRFNDSFRASLGAGFAMDTNVRIDDALALGTLKRVYSENHGDLATLLELKPDVYDFDGEKVATPLKARLSAGLSYRPVKDIPFSIAAEVSWERGLPGIDQIFREPGPGADGKGWWEQARQFGVGTASLTFHFEF